MNIWTLIVAATACGGALLVWHMVSRTKHVSEEMLVKYGEMLKRARADKAKTIADAADDTVTTAEPAPDNLDGL